MLPQDAYDSPHRRQRFIELHNVGSETIPGYAVAEVVESSRPEKAGTVTPGGGRTVLHIRLATTDDPCATVIVGPCEIAPDGWGKPGTIDDPMLALVAEEYPNGTDVGVEAGSFLLTSGHCGYRIYGGDFDATTQTQRVIRTDDCQDEKDMMVRATECILPGRGGSVKRQEWNSTTQCWEDSDDAEFDIIDPMGWLLAVPGDCFKIDRSKSRCGATASRSDYMPSFPFGMTQLVRVMQQINCGDCGEVTIVRKQIGGSASLSGEHCDTVATECKFLACNMSYRPISCDAQEYAIAHIIPGQCCIGSDTGSGESGCIAFLMPYPRPMFAKGTLTADMCEGAATLTDSAILDACPASDFQPPTVADNPAKLHACSGTDVLAFWTVGDVGESCAWKAFAVEDYELPDYAIDIRCGTGESACTVEKKTKTEKRYGHFCKCDADADEWTATEIVGEVYEIPMGIGADEIGSQQVLTNADCGTCSFVFENSTNSSFYLKLTTKKFCLFCNNAELEDGTDIVLDDWAFLAAGSPGTNITIEGTPIDVLTEAKIEYDAGSGGSGEGCPPGSGSASGTTLSITGKTKTVCTFCSADSEGTFSDGVDIDLLDGLSFGLMVAVSEAVFDCSGCPTFTSKFQTGYVLCVTAETELDPMSCECNPCEGSGSGS